MKDRMAMQATEAKAASTSRPARAAGTKPESASGLLADLALLQGVGSAAKDEAGLSMDGVQPWKPPDDQKGDGRTKLNDLLGY